MVWPRVCPVWPLLCTTVWPMVWTTVWPKVFSVFPMVSTMSGHSGQWCPKSVQSGQWWPESARSGQYLSLGIVGLANAFFGYGRSGQYLSFVADFILGRTCLRNQSFPKWGFNKHFGKKLKPAPFICPPLVDTGVQILHVLEVYY